MIRSFWKVAMWMFITSVGLSQHLVDGYVFLENVSVFDGSKVRFIERTVDEKSDSAYTDEAGLFALSLQTGIYDVDITHAGYYPHFIDGLVVTGNQTLPNILLEVPIELSGYCQLENSDDHSDIQIELSRVESDESFQVYTNVVGRFEAFVQRGIYNVSFTKDGYIPILNHQVTVNTTGSIGNFTLATEGEALALTPGQSDIITTGTYIVSEDINDSGPLHIEPGVKIYFMSEGRLSVAGIVTAEGTPEEPILFTTYPGETNQFLFELIDNDEASKTHTFRFCEFTGQTGSAFVFGGVETGQDSLEFHSCTFHDMSPTYHLIDLTALSSQGSPKHTIILDNCALWNNYNNSGYAAIFVQHSLNLQITNSFFQNNATGGGCIQHGGQDGEASVELNHSIFVQNGMLPGEYFGWAGVLDVHSDTMLVTNCVFYDHLSETEGSIITCSESPQINIINNIFVDGDQSILGLHGEGETHIQYNCFDLAQINEYSFLGPNIPQLFGSEIDENYNNDPCDIYQNIFLEPVFVDELSFDFNLQEHSPAIDAGDPDFPEDPDNTISDIGAYPYFQGPHPILDIENEIVFENVEIGMSATSEFHIQNTGDEPLIVDDISYTGTVFTYSHDAIPITVPPGGLSTVDVTFSPIEIREYVSEVTVTTNARIAQTTVGGNGVPLAGQHSSSLILSGRTDGQFGWDYLYDYTLPTTNAAYLDMAYGRYYGDNRLYYMNPIAFQDWNGDGVDDFVVDEPTITPLNVELAINSLVDETDAMFPNVLFFASHGHPTNIEINGTPTDNIDIVDLASWIDAAQLDINTPLIVMFEACFSGNYIPPIADNNRIVISACEGSQFADYLLNGESFSTRFWEEIWYGNSVGEAFDVASTWSYTFLNQQIPQIDADGNGIPNEASDFTIADATYIGGEFVHGAVLPELIDAPDRIESDSDSLVLWAEFNMTMSNVWCRVLPEHLGGGSSPEEYPIFNLSHIEGFRYEASIPRSLAFPDTGDAVAKIYGLADYYNTIMPRRVALINNQSSGLNEAIPLPSSYKLLPAYPNPFNPQTTIEYTLPEPAKVVLTVFDIRGRIISTLVDDYKSAGMHRVTWQGLDQSGMHMASGLYLCRMISGDYAATVKLMYMK